MLNKYILNVLTIFRICKGTFCNSRSQEKLHIFTRKTIKFLAIANCRICHLLKKNYAVVQENFIQFLVIAVCKNRPLSADQDLKRNCTVFREDYEVSRDLQKLAFYVINDHTFEGRVQLLPTTAVGEILANNVINNVSACSVLFLSTTGLFPARRKILEHETQSSALTFF